MTSVTIEERGRGFPKPGDYVPGDDGELYEVERIIGPIHTSQRPGGANYVHADVTLVQWDACESGEEFSAMVVLP